MGRRLTKMSDDHSAFAFRDRKATPRAAREDWRQSPRLPPARTDVRDGPLPCRLQSASRARQAVDISLF